MKSTFQVTDVFWLWKKLGVVPPHELSGLRLDPDGCWVITAARWDSKLGFASLPKLVRADAVLYLEGGAHSDEITAFLSATEIEAVEQIARGTIWPRQKIYHLPATEEVLMGLSKLADHHALPEICDHLVVYRQSLVLVDWYDVFDRDAYVSSEIPEQAVDEFAKMVGGSYRFEKS